MEITRKSFLSGAAIGLAGLTLLPADAFAAPPNDPGEDGPGLRWAVGETFYARSASGILVPLGLKRSVDVRSDARTDQFSLYFTADERFSVAEGTWRLVSSRGRRVGDVFLVPAGTEASGRQLLRADFCLLESVKPADDRR